MLFRPRVVRRRSRIILRPLLWTLLAVFLIDAWLILRSRGRTVRSPVAAPGIARDALASAEPPANTSVFIVSVHRNTEPILRDSWVDSVVRLVDHLGADNVYVSAIESGSQDNTKEALLGLKALLSARGVAHTIELGATVWQQLEELNAWPAPDAPPAKRRGWIWHADEGHLALRRIPYLARVRNQAMAPLLAAARGPQPRYFDRVLWINDVAFDTADVLTLLDTRGGHYAAACAMDFKTYPYYYDTFALRDEHGDKAVSAHWPWLRSAGGRADVRAGRPVRVQSCWNGMIVFDARPFYDITSSSSSSSSAARPNADGMAAQPPAAAQPAQPAQPLLFRGIEDSLAELHLEASECCLIHADNPLSNADWAGPAGSKDSRSSRSSRSSESSESSESSAKDGSNANKNVGVWLNPNVRVAYSTPVYKQVRQSVFPSALWAVRGMWANRWERAKSHVQFALESQMVLKRLRLWRAETPAGQPPRSEPGAICLINEMQIMWQNGWKHL